MVNNLLRRLANAPEPHTAPNPVEMAGMHVLYVFSLILLVFPALSPMGVKWVNPLALLPMFFVMLCLAWGYLAWLALARKPTVGVWFAAHAAWLTVTYVGLLVIGALALGLFAVVVLFAAAVREAAYLLRSRGDFGGRGPVDRGEGPLGICGALPTAPGGVRSLRERSRRVSHLKPRSNGETHPVRQITLHSRSI